jgi:hypothetical protein
MLKIVDELQKWNSEVSFTEVSFWLRFKTTI